MKKPRNKEVQKQDRQKAYLLRQKQEKHKVTFYRFFFFALFLALWQTAASLHWIDSFFFSSPFQVLQCMADLIVRKNLLLHIGITLEETLISFLLVFVFGMIFATVLWFSERISRVTEPYLVVLNSLPKSALAPLFIVWLGTGMKTIVIAGISVAVFGSVISLYTGFQQVDAEKLTLIRTLGGNRQDAFRKVVLPASIPTILSTMKVNIGLALVGVIIGEFLAAKRGLGYLIIYGSQVFQMHMVITSIVILCVIAMGLYFLLQWVEHLTQRGT